jgi:hypothetical protein
MNESTVNYLTTQQSNLTPKSVSEMTTQEKQIKVMEKTVNMDLDAIEAVGALKFCSSSHTLGLWKVDPFPHQNTWTVDQDKKIPLPMSPHATGTHQLMKNPSSINLITELQSKRQKHLSGKEKSVVGHSIQLFEKMEAQRSAKKVFPPNQQIGVLNIAEAGLHVALATQSVFEILVDNNLLDLNDEITKNLFSYLRIHMDRFENLTGLANQLISLGGDKYAKAATLVQKMKQESSFSLKTDARGGKPFPR